MGAYAAEIYHRWALNRGVPPEEIKINKDLVRLSAMLHDVGKVAISDLILKKPAGLDTEEFTIMKFHTILGARLFLNPESDLDVMAGEIALNHHEKWDGGGYPGRIDDLASDQVRLGPGKRGEEIPLFARIVALADVYDALGSKRSYKDPFSEARTLELIETQSGKQFDRRWSGPSWRSGRSLPPSRTNTGRSPVLLPRWAASTCERRLPPERDSVG